MRSCVALNNLMRMSKRISCLLLLNIKLLPKHLYDAISRELSTKPIPRQEHTQQGGRVASQEI
jgi:hypothetical protein